MVEVPTGHRRTQHEVVAAVEEKDHPEPSRQKDHHHHDVAGAEVDSGEGVVVGEGKHSNGVDVPCPQDHGCQGEHDEADLRDGQEDQAAVFEEEDGAQLYSFGSHVEPTSEADHQEGQHHSHNYEDDPCSNQRIIRIARKSIRNVGRDCYSFGLQDEEDSQDEQTEDSEHDGQPDHWSRAAPHKHEKQQRQDHGCHCCQQQDHPPRLQVVDPFFVGPWFEDRLDVDIDHIIGHTVRIQ